MVVAAFNGDEALNLLDGAVKVDLVLTHLMMPRMDGAQLVEQIRTRFPQMLIFMSSTQLPPHHIYRMLDGYFAKPLDVGTFKNYVSARGIGSST